MMNFLKRKPRGFVAYSTIVLALVASSALACQVPVFRYALERWPADQFELVVLHAGPLDEASQARFAKLQAARTDKHLNLQIRSLEVRELRDRVLKQLWQTHSSSTQPLMVLLYPRNARDIPDRVAHVSPLTDDSAARLIESPVRRELAKRLVSGESAVWIFVPSGDAELDAVALKELTTQVKVSQQELMLPTAEEMEIDEAVLKKNKIELRLAFSILTLDRKDAGERLLLELLLGSEADLETLNEPMAFPVLGRGRVLYALVGKGIQSQTVAAACRFVAGPCSCQVKDQNPGFDLLLSHDWDKAVGDSMISDAIPESGGEPRLLKIPPGRASR